MDKQELVKQKQDLIRKYDANEISESEYTEQYGKVEAEIQKAMNEEIDEKNNQMETDKNNESENQKEDTQPKPGRGPHKNSNTTLILQGLKDDDVKSDDDAIKYVLSKKEGLDKKKLLTQLKSIKRLCKTHKQKRYNRFSFDEDTYSLTEE